MKNTKKAFTLVELIVVITILAVLATVAFISLTGYSQEAKNSKVTADLRTMVSAVETKMTKESIVPTTLIDTIVTTVFDDNQVAGTVTYGSGKLLSASSYDVGTMDFQALGQNGDDFNADGKPYAFAAVATSYQFAGEILEDGQYKAILKGNYVETIDGDADALFVANDTTTFLSNTSASGSTQLY